jgi:O-antigen polymerase
MALFSIVASLIALAAVYLYVSRREKSYVNVLTPAFVVMVPTEYLLEIYHIVNYGPSGSTYAYMLSYGCYAAFTVAFALAYTGIRVPALSLPFDGYPVRRARFPAYVLLLLALALYLPVLIKFHGLLTDPREIYRQTRTGYGIYFFISTSLAYLGFIVLLFAKKVRALEVLLFLLACTVFVWLQGSKGHLLGFIFILAIYWTYVKGRRTSFPKFVLFSLGMGMFGMVLFLITTPSLILGGGLEGLSAYSDYTRNGMLVIDEGLGPFYGRLTLEDQVYTRIPRAVFPDKPRDFGDFYLAERFYPNAFEANAGLPAFGNGAWFADFGVLAMPLLLALGFLNGLMLKGFMRGLQRHQSPGGFVMVMFASGTSLIPIAGAFYLPENLLLAVLANALCRIGKRRLPGHLPQPAACP